MKILLVDDNAIKRGRVRHELAGIAAELSIEITEAKDYEEALTALQGQFFDLVILDLMLPGAGGNPSSETSRAIIRRVLQGSGLIPPMQIIGLTEYADAAVGEESFYDENLLALEIFSEDNLDWAAKIESRIRYLVKSKNAAALFQANSFDFDVVVLTARFENEFLPVKDSLFTSIETESHPQWSGRIAVGSIGVPGRRSLRVALCCISEMGMAPAAAAASQAIAVFRPRLLAMLGMCCGFNSDACASPRKLMDVIIAREVKCWEEGRYVELVKSAGNQSEFMNRARARLIDDAIRSDVERVWEESVTTLNPALERFATTGPYFQLRKHFGEEQVRDVPDVQLSLMVSGSSVIADETMVEEILTRNPGAVGLDMELYGVYTAAEKCGGRRPSVLGIKGVADFGTAKKDEKAQIAASTLATEVFKATLCHLAVFA